MVQTQRIAIALRAGLVALALGAATPVLALDDMGKEPGARLLARCEAVQRLFGPAGSQGLNADQQADAQACLGFVEGFVWGHAWASWREARDMWFCLPPDFSAVQGVPVVVGYLKAHPDRLEEEAHLLVFLALTAGYPCKP
jgi:hypothetical protein